MAPVLERAGDRFDGRDFGVDRGRRQVARQGDGRADRDAQGDHDNRRDTQQPQHGKTPRQALDGLEHEESLGPAQGGVCDLPHKIP